MHLHLEATIPGRHVRPFEPVHLGERLGVEGEHLAPDVMTCSARVDHDRRVPWAGKRQLEARNALIPLLRNTNLFLEPALHLPF